MNYELQIKNTGDSVITNSGIGFLL